MMPRITFLACCLLVPAIAESGRVSLVVSDNFGNPVRVSRASVTAANGGEIRLSQEGETAIPYGAYTLSVSAAGFEKTTAPISVDQPRQVLSIALRIGAIENQVKHCSIYGRVHLEVAASRVRAMQLFGSMLTDVAVSQDGSYGFVGLECGDYAVMVLGPQGCLTARHSHVTDDSRIDFTNSFNDRAGCPTSK